MEALESLLSSDRSMRNPEMKLGLMRLASETRERVSQGSPASTEYLVRALRLLSKMRGTAHADLRLGCLFELHNFFYMNGQSTEALQASGVMEHLASQSSNKQWIRKASNLSGIIQSELGNTAEAVISYARAIELARDLNEVLAETSVLINLGVAFNYGGLYREAIPCLRRSLGLARQASQPEFQIPALTNLAQSHFYLEEFDEAFRLINESIKQSIAPKDAYSATNRVVREYTYIQIALEIGEFKRAKESYQRCLQFSHLAGTTRAKHLLQITSAQFDIYFGEISAGIQQLESLVQASWVTPTTRLTALKALITAYDRAGDAERAWRCVSDLIEYLRAEREKGLAALMSVSNLLSLGSSQLGPSELSVLTRKEAILRAKSAEQALMNSRLEILERLAMTADIRDEESGAHGYRVGKLSALLAERLHWPKEDCVALESAARLHDIGKLAVPDRVLLSRCELSAEDRKCVSVHTLVGAEMLGKSDIPQLKLAADIAKYHHERWDGTGYPLGLAGVRIPRCARIVALADVFDALTHGRPYALPWTIDHALAQIESASGTHFDPEMVAIFTDLVRSLSEQHPDLDAYLEGDSHKSLFQQARSRIRSLIGRINCEASPTVTK